MAKKANHDNATVNPCTLNLDRMTCGYFYPDVVSGDVSQMKVPTVDELAFLGKNNLHEILCYVRSEERKLRKACKDACQALSQIKYKSLENVRHERAASDGVIYCNWRGMGYANLPPSLEDELMRKGDCEAYCATMSKREVKVFTCKFGRDVAEWCSKTPNYHQCDNKCCRNAIAAAPLVMSTSATETVSVASPGEATHDAISKCLHYDKCFGSEPFAGEHCVFNSADDKILNDCKRYLDNVIADYKKRLGFVQIYIANMKAAIRDRHIDYRPPFNLDVHHSMSLAKNGTRIIMISKDLGMLYGVICKSKDRYGKDIWNAILDDEPENPIKLWSYHDNYPMRPFCGIVLRNEDFNYLCDNPDFSRVWLQMVNPFGTGIMLDELAHFLGITMTLRAVEKKSND